MLFLPFLWFLALHIRGDNWCMALKGHRRSLAVARRRQVATSSLTTSLVHQIRTETRVRPLGQQALLFLREVASSLLLARIILLIIIWTTIDFRWFPRGFFRLPVVIILNIED